jgi:hypothetical protein
VDDAVSDLEVHHAFQHIEGVVQAVVDVGRRAGVAGRELVFGISKWPPVSLPRTLNMVTPPPPKV